MLLSNIIIDVDIVLGRPIILWTYNILGRGEILLKKNMNGKKNLESNIIEENNPFEIKALYVILLNYRSSLEQKDVKEAKNQHSLYELYKNLNPKYFEEIILLKEATLKVYSSDIVYSSKFNIFRSY